MRALILVMDSVGIGGAPDAQHYGDRGRRHRRSHRRRLRARASRQRRARGAPAASQSRGDGPGSSLSPCHGPYSSRSRRRRETSIHNSAAQARYRGARIRHPDIGKSPAFPSRSSGAISQEQVPCFPAELMERLCAQAGLPGILGNCHASGTEIIAEFGERHMQSGEPICYTSADSVFPDRRP